MACFSKTPETFGARKAIFSSSVSKHGEVYAPETSRIKGTSVYIKKLRINSSEIVRFEILLWLSGPEKFPRGFGETGPRPRTRKARSGDERTNHDDTAPSVPQCRKAINNYWTRVL